MPVPGPRSAVSGARRRVVPHLPAVLQTAAAAVISWYLAVLLLPDDRPAFASIAAVICVSITYGKRRWRALELVGGVVLGISISSVLLYLIGTGPIQIGLLVILAMTAALVFRGGELLVNEAAISAILLASLQSADAGFSADRILEGLIGGSVGLVIASLLLPPDPVAMVSRVAQTVVGKLGSTLEEAAEALAGRDVARAEGALEAARGIDDDIDALEAVLPVASDTARFSPSRRRDRDLLLRYVHTMPQVDFAVRNTRVLARLVLRHTRGDEAAPEGLSGGGARARRGGLGARRAVRRAGAPDAPARARAQRRPVRDGHLRARALAVDHADRRPGALDRRRSRPCRRPARRVRGGGVEPADGGAAGP